MSATALDTNVLLDLLVPGSAHGAASEAALDDATPRGPLVLSPVAYAELLTYHVRLLGAEEGQHDLDLFLHESGIRIVPMPAEAWATAGKAFATYLAGRNAGHVECPSCGARNEVKCKACKKPIAWRAHILTDFLVGAHALHTADALLTRDRHLHKRIPGLKILEP
jgi:predicted nucleic acid-binding protein